MKVDYNKLGELIDWYGGIVADDLAALPTVSDARDEELTLLRAENARLREALADVGVEIEFMALPCPLPEAERQQLINFGVAALVARSNADARTIQTIEGQELADFESRLRDQIGVLHRRERFVCGGANESHP